MLGVYSLLLEPKRVYDGYNKISTINGKDFIKQAVSLIYAARQ